MLPAGWLVVAVVVAVLLTTWVTFTVTRLDRLHARVDAARAAMDAQLVRRAAALLHVAEASDLPVPEELRRRCHAIGTEALNAQADDAARQHTENAVGRAVIELTQLRSTLPAEAEAELREAAARVLIARRFYNDAVRDTRALRARRLPRLLRMAGRRELPQFFDIDDTAPGRVPSGQSPPKPDTAGTQPAVLPESAPSGLTEKDDS